MSSKRKFQNYPGKSIIMNHSCRPRGGDEFLNGQPLKKRPIPTEYPAAPTIGNFIHSSVHSYKFCTFTEVVECFRRNDLTLGCGQLETELTIASRLGFDYKRESLLGKAYDSQQPASRSASGVEWVWEKKSLLSSNFEGNNTPAVHLQRRNLWLPLLFRDLR
ncbi:hypothetical protein R1flu_007683 [Riccia fluitans]|uniref:Uncharacterized protein n=1 Tax=Riccia fluitans TaxID=41844 RepID=A0ABD1Z284_9MARC